MPDASTSAELELEYTFLASALPHEIQGVVPKRLVDIYLPEAGVVHPILRIRNKGGKMEITKKSPVQEGDASAQIERTIPLDQNEYDTLSQVSRRRVVKDRYDVAIDGYPAEVDVFLEDLKGLVLIDFEFSSEEERSRFRTPKICLADVTQEEFIAGGLLAGKKFADIAERLRVLNYTALI